jgi:hypothetical protein
VLVLDGQGGGIGAAVIKGLREAFQEDLEIYGLGTNSIATSTMMKAGANRGATGENAIKVSSRKADVIVGPLAILMANSMMGEVTETIASSVASSGARKVLIPLTQENVFLVGVSGEPLPHMVKKVVEVVKEMNKDV